MSRHSKGRAIDGHNMYNICWSCQIHVVDVAAASAGLLRRRLDSVCAGLGELSIIIIMVTRQTTSWSTTEKWGERAVKTGNFKRFKSKFKI
jgi:hypothetical protein